MSWELDAEHRDFQAVFRAFVDRHVRPAVGGSGYMKESAVARHYRDVRVLRIGGGSDDIQLEIVSRELTP
jgi:acyl-CoA dehydrogenase